MPATFKVDQAATFSGVAYLSSSPKVRFGETTQETTKDGVPKWEVQVIGGFRNGFGKVDNEVMKITVASHKDPTEGLAQFMPIHLTGFEVGVMEKRNRANEIVGVQVYYRAESVTSAVSTFRTNGAGKVEA